MILMYKALNEQEMANIIGGEYISAEGIMALMSVLAILVSIYKMYTSTKGGAKIGSNYSFEWS